MPTPFASALNKLLLSVLFVPQSQCEFVCVWVCVFFLGFLCSLPRFFWTSWKRAWTLVKLFLYQIYFSISGNSDGKESACNLGDPSSIPVLRNSLGEGNGNPFQYSYLENSMDGRAWWATYNLWSLQESDTTEWLHFQFPLRSYYSGNIIISTRLVLNL